VDCLLLTVYFTLKSLKEVKKLSPIAFLSQFLPDNLIQIDLTASRQELFHVPSEADKNYYDGVYTDVPKKENVTFQSVCGLSGAQSPFTFWYFSDCL